MAGSGDFAGFSLLDPGGQPKTAYWEIERVPKIAGSPLLANPVSLNPWLVSKVVKRRVLL